MNDNHNIFVYGKYFRHKDSLSYVIYKIYNIDDQLVMNHRLLKYKKIQENKPKEKKKAS